MTGMRMTRDEVRELIAEALADLVNDRIDSNDPGYFSAVADFYPEAEAVLAALAARGIVLATVADLNSDEWEQLNVSWRINEPPCKAVIAKVPDLGLALVRIVPND